MASGLLPAEPDGGARQMRHAEAAGPLGALVMRIPLKRWRMRSLVVSWMLADQIATLRLKGEASIRSVPSGSYTTYFRHDELATMNPHVQLDLRQRPGTGREHRRWLARFGNVLPLNCGW